MSLFRNPILLPSQTSGSYLRSTTRSFIGMHRRSVGDLDALRALRAPQCPCSGTRSCCPARPAGRTCGRPRAPSSGCIGAASVISTRSELFAPRNVLVPEPDLVAQPDQRVVLAVDHALLHRDASAQRR